MNLFIQVKDGQTVNHPAFEDNLIQAFGSIPPDWEPFVRVVRPNPGIYEVLVSNEPVYNKVDGVWTDVWNLRPMTVEEKEARQQVAKDAWASRYQASNWSAWIFDEETCSYIPPIPRPDPIPGQLVFWSGADNNWKQAPNPPTDGKNYQFDFYEWKWNEVI